MYHLQVHLLFFFFRFSHAVLVLWLPVCWSACISACPWVPAAPSYPSCLRSNSRRQNTHLITTQSLTSSPIFLFSPLNVHLINHNVSDFWVILFQLLLGRTATRRESRQSSPAAIFPEPPVSDGSRVDSGSGSSNAARQLLQKHNYPNTRAGCPPVSWLVGGWNGRSRRSEKAASYADPQRFDGARGFRNEGLWAIWQHKRETTHLSRCLIGITQGEWGL